MKHCQLRGPDNTPQRARFPVIDAHNHLWSAWDRIDAVVSTMDATGVVAYCDLTADINVRFANGGNVVAPGDFQVFLDKASRPHPGKFYAFTTAGMMRPPSEPLYADSCRFVEETLERLHAHHARGALGLKLGKEFGMIYRDTAGNLINCDDPVFQPIWAEAARLGMPVLIHEADPIAFFDAMTDENEQLAVLKEFPAWSFVDRSRYPAFEDLQSRYWHLAASNPATTFLYPHLANWPENLDFLSERLATHPNVCMDFSARCDELGRQPYRARAWMIQWQDRIFFGTDMPVSVEMYRFHFRFLETFDEYFLPPFVDGTFGRHRWRVYGLGLPDSVLQKIYHRNILRILPSLRNLIQIESC